ncbi:MAG: hypothetical protein H6705_00350 [Myxococcales bacterium]|nr:hypothetical protein [Myxococcales bacterium]
MTLEHPDIPESDDPIAELMTRGVTRLPGVLTREVAERLAEAAAEVFARLDEEVAEKGPWAVQQALAPGIRYVPTASSLSLTALGELGGRIAAVLEAVLSPVLIPALRAPPRLLADQAWLRRQLPPARAPRHHAPHRWHQDGALGFDFLGGDPESPDALLPMITAWVPLVPCGRDAPGLRYVPERRDTLAPLGELDGPHPHVEAPALGAGDVVLLHGGTLHATHVTPEMTTERVSIELRWLPADHPGRDDGASEDDGNQSPA